ncbi:MAG: 2,3-diphosphoglycerate-dependent phosphoglycerate mutase [Chloroflexi bacterium]|nr:MAG: 2,3-diphosphoglycerate-dependent phosphoglycerate mutase [Chloroflexota bacterium]TME02507.1 MAG: 2,3-diphosphoglycerate-dependent phosphoglycerate mutase [Chloroflexota bacterium]TME40202.1 MAG: 2,3-diphosphoglycerate-dependent phosphoglycerate mutase [Chloroflexota bacterium]TME53156.1 MAG: 2,3-diphosphoglycerate-dependent phosphoglycerate mutase [Chloroflexota bacterium]
MRSAKGSGHQPLRPSGPPPHEWGGATARQPGTLVLLRHGESTWNLENLFTGWTDVPLSERGVKEAVEAGRLMKEAGLRPGVVHESLLLRAIQTTQRALAEMDLSWIPVKRSWRLNERHYGALQGLNKRQTAEKYGEEKVNVWRRSYDVRPPDLEASDKRHASHDPRYATMPPELLPSAECLKDVLERTLPYWYDAIVPDLLAQPCVLVSAHGNSLRALVKHLDRLSDAEVVELNIPTGVPRVYELDADLRPMAWRYLGDPAEVERRTAAVKAQGSKSSST